MTQLTRRTSPPTTTATDGRRSGRGPRSTSREARTRRSFDGVVASYLRELAAGDAGQGSSSSITS